MSAEAGQYRFDIDVWQIVWDREKAHSGKSTAGLGFHIGAVRKRLSQLQNCLLTPYRVHGVASAFISALALVRLRSCVSYLD